MDLLSSKVCKTQILEGIIGENDKKYPLNLRLNICDAIVVSIITFLLSLFIEASIGVMWNMPGVGIIFAVAFIGGIILYSVAKKK